MRTPSQPVEYLRCHLSNNHKARRILVYRYIGDNNLPDRFSVQSAARVYKAFCQQGTSRRLSKLFGGMYLFSWVIFEVLLLGLKVDYDTDEKMHRAHVSPPRGISLKEWYGNIAIFVGATLSSPFSDCHSLYTLISMHTF